MPDLTRLMILNAGVSVHMIWIICSIANLWAKAKPLYAINGVANFFIIHWWIFSAIIPARYISPYIVAVGIIVIVINIFSYLYNIFAFYNIFSFRGYLKKMRIVLWNYLVVRNKSNNKM